MSEPFLEHVNVTVSNPERTANFLCEIFDWKIRWHGNAIDNGITYHVGTDKHYIALYTHNTSLKPDRISYATVTGLNHIGIVVDNLEKAETKILAKGYKTFSHADYEPGRRFYFRDDDDIEFEIISYSS